MQAVTGTDQRGAHVQRSRTQRHGITKKRNIIQPSLEIRANERPNERGIGCKVPDEETKNAHGMHPLANNGAHLLNCLQNKPYR